MQTGQPNSIILAGQPVEYRIVRSRSAKQLRARVGPGGMTVTVPEGRGPEVADFLSENAAWVTAQIDRVERLRGVRRPRQRESTLLYRGEVTLVHFEEQPDKRGAARVWLDDTGIRVVYAACGATPPERSLENWLRKQAAMLIHAELAPLTQKVNRTPNRVYIMGQRTKWGNCSRHGNLSFNWRLVLAPSYVLRYLVTHEVVHLAVPDHSRTFWLTVQSLCPEAERARQWLCVHGSRLYNELQIPGRAGNPAREI